MLLLLLRLLIGLHPFFLSVTEAEYDDKEKLIGISCKFFGDDLEKTLNKASSTPVDIFRGNKSTNTSRIKSYLDRHFSIKVNGQPVMLDVLGYEIEGDAIFVYMEARNVNPPRQVEISTDMLYDLDKGQINLVHFVYRGKRETQRLTYPDNKVVYNW